MAAVATDSGTTPGRIGPNAILQTIEALRSLRGEQELAQVFAGAGLAHRLDDPPLAMIDEREVARLHQFIRAHHPAPVWQSILSDAGQRTGEYVLAHRIPAPVRWLLRSLPPAAASRLLLNAIERHAWTFVGSGDFRVCPGRPVRVEIHHNPVVAGERATEPVCYWHAAVFATLFRRLVTTSAQAIEIDCCAAGAPACAFEIDY